MRKIDTLYVHYSASGDLGSAAQSRATIDGWHKARGWPMIGYHAGCTPRGERFIGRPDSMIGAHVKFHNTNSLGYCCVGDDLKKTPWFPTDAQYEDAAAWCREKMAKYGILITNVRGHRDDGPTSCPGPFDVDKLKQMIQAKPKEEEDMGWSNRQSWTRVVQPVEFHTYQGRNEGQGTDENAYVAITPFDGNAAVKVQVIGDGAEKTKQFIAKRNKQNEVNLAEWGISGPVVVRVSSDIPVTITVDRRGAPL